MNEYYEVQAQYSDSPQWWEQLAQRESKEEAIKEFLLFKEQRDYSSYRLVKVKLEEVDMSDYA